MEHPEEKAAPQSHYRADARCLTVDVQDDGYHHYEAPTTGYDDEAINPLGHHFPGPTGKIDFEYVARVMNEATLSRVPSEEKLIDTGHLLIDTDWSQKPKHFSDDDFHRHSPKFQYYSEKIGIVETDRFGDLGHPVMENMRSAPFLLDICYPDESTMKLIAEAFGIHPLTLEDILTQSTREKIEMYSGYLYLNIRGIAKYQVGTSLRGVNIHFLLTPEFVIVCHAEPAFDMNDILKRIQKIRLNNAITTGWIVYAILDHVVDLFMPIVQSAEFDSDAIDELILEPREADQRDMLLRMWSVRKNATQLYRLLYTKPEIFKNLTKRAPTIFHQESVIYFRDIQDHVITMVQNLNNCQEILKTSHSNYLSQIDIEINRESRKLSFVMKKLTATATILMPLTLVSGLWGMNVHVPGSEVPGSALWFWVIIICMTVFSVLMTTVGRMRHWF